MNNKSSEILKKELQKLVENKIKDVKCVDDINWRSLITSASGVTDYDEIKYQHFYLSKKILQITINIFNDFENFKDFTFKFVGDEDARYIIDQSCYSYDTNNHLWKCKHKPDKDYLIDRLLHYILCFVSLKQTEAVSTGDYQNIEKTPIHIDLCTFCDTKMTENEDKCKVCNATKAEIMLQYASSGKVKENVQIVDKVVPKEIVTMSTNRTTDCVRPIDFSVYDDKGEYTKGNDFQVTTNEEQKAKVENIVYGKWICGDCGFYNEYSALNCTVCTSKFDEGLWDCKHCTGKNSCKDGVCHICNERNVVASDRVNVTGPDCCVGKSDLTSSNVDRRSRNEESVSSQDRTEDQWYCSECATMNLYGLDNCRMCSKSQMKFGRWLCDKCTLRNKFSDKKCDACQTVDKKKVYQGQKKTDKKAKEKPKSDDNKGKWQCLHLNCKNMNKSKDEYCSVCKLSRHLSRGVGDLVKKMTKKGPEHVWICHSCNKFNDKDAVKCAGSGCSKKRRDPIICRSCRATSDTRTENCAKCGDKFC